MPLELHGKEESENADTRISRIRNLGTFIVLTRQLESVRAGIDKIAVTVVSR